MTETEYPDRNGNGVPDAFEHRRSITEILQDDDSSNEVTESAGESPPASLDEAPTATLIIEIGKRSPKRGEMYLNSYDGRICVERYGNSRLSEVIVKQIVSAPSYWKPQER